MPPKLPHLSGKEVTRRLGKLGFIVVRQKGSHVFMRRNSQGCVVPNHKALKTGTLGGVLKQAGVTIDEFMHVK